jgi:arylsulfatase A-like enzyme
MGSMKGLLIMAGPGIKKGFSLKRTVWLTDIVPTLCCLLDLPVPRDTEGAIIYQAFEDPNMKLKEAQSIRKNYARLKNAIDKEKALAHSYSA